MGFGEWANQQASKFGRTISHGADTVGSAVSAAGATVWSNRSQVLDAVISTGVIAGGIAGIAAGGPLGTVAGAGAIVSGAEGLTTALGSVQGGPKDPLSRRSKKAKKRKHDKVDAHKTSKENVDNTGSKQPKISGDQRARMANLASMR